jgi:hypothetical protein
VAWPVMIGFRDWKSLGKEKDIGRAGSQGMAEVLGEGAVVVSRVAANWENGREKRVRFA